MPQKPPAKAPRGIWRCSQKAAKASGEGAARHLKPGYCPQNAAKCLTPLFLGRAPPADGWGRRIFQGFNPIWLHHKGILRMASWGSDQTPPSPNSPKSSTAIPLRKLNLQSPVASPTFCWVLHMFLLSKWSHPASDGWSWAPFSAMNFPLKLSKTFIYPECPIATFDFQRIFPSSPCLLLKSS